MKSCVIVARVSSDDQEKTGYSLPSQKKLLTDYSSNKGFSINKTFEITESASKRDQRKVFGEMMNYVDNKDIKVIIFEKVDRVTRNLQDSVKIYNWLEDDEERQIHCVKNSLILHKNSRSQEKLQWDIHVVLAKNYADNLSEEVNKGLREKAQQGWLPRKAPFGYKSVGERGKKIHVVNKSEAKYIIRMFELYSTGNYSIKMVQEQIYKEGLRSRNGKKVSKSRVADYLSEIFYFGKFKWKGNTYEGKHEPIISKELYDIVQNLMKSRTTPKYHKHNFAFKSMFKCKRCGGTITWEKQKEFVYGHCNHYRECTAKKWAREDTIDDMVKKIIDKRLKIKSVRLRDWLKRALKYSYKSKVEYNEEIIDDMQSEVNRVNKKLDTIYDDKLDGLITPERYIKKKKDLEIEISNILENINDYRKKRLKLGELNLKIYNISQNGGEEYIKGNPDKKRGVLRLIFKKLWLDEDVMTYELTPAMEIISKAVKITNENSSKIQNIEQVPENIFELLDQGNKGIVLNKFSVEIREMLRGQDSNLQPID